jgi:peptidoglycan/LPS O-acetylase OafA/YrhL
VNQKLEWLEVLRGAAALAVTLVHLSNGMSEPQYSGTNPYGGLFKYGFYGVDFFFVLSGFIIAWTAHGLQGRPSETVPYLLRRFFRIFPTYWVVLTVAIAINFFVQRNKFPYGQESMLAQYLLTTTDSFWLGPAWTLQHEWIFYLAFLSVFFSTRLCIGIFGAWLGGMAVHGLTVSVPEMHIQTFYDKVISPYGFNFLIGVFAATQCRDGKTRTFASVTVSLLFVTIALGMFGNEVQSKLAFRYLAPAICFTLVVYFAALLSLRGVPAPQPLVWFGGLTFSLYITHILPSGILYAVLAKVGLYKQLNHHLILISALLLCLLTSILVNKFVEKPSISLGRALENRYRKSLLSKAASKERHS